MFEFDSPFQDEFEFTANLGLEVFIEFNLGDVLWQITDEHCGGASGDLVAHSLRYHGEG
jgi:hypothetical protein